MNVFRPALLLAPLLLAACSGGSTMDTLVGQSDLVKDIMPIYERLFWITAFLFVLVQGLLLYIVFRFRARGDEKTLPEQVHGNTQMEIGWTIAPAVILIFIAIPTVAFIFKTQAPPSPDALKINAVGKQWWFAFEYPDLGVVTANELHVPLGKEVNLRLQSTDVIHSFWAPQITAKRDMIPGKVNTIKFTADKAGTYLGQCAEYCADSHAWMRFRVMVDTPEDFEKWVAAQKAPADAESEAAKAGFQAFTQATCVACHAIGGTSAVATIGPDLTHIGSRTTIAAGVLPNDTENLRKWLKDPTAIKPGSKMPNLNLSDEQLDALVPYLQSLK